ncbi:hypothetical protein GGI35DRAFT_407061 [Trichoderma velutinum]
MEQARLPDGNLSTILHLCCPTICPLAPLVAQACGSAIGYRRAPEALSRAIHGSEAVTSHCEKTMIPALHLADSKCLTCDSGLRRIGVLCSTHAGCQSNPMPSAAGYTRLWTVLYGRTNWMPKDNAARLQCGLPGLL